MSGEEKRDTANNSCTDTTRKRNLCPIADEEKSNKNLSTKSQNKERNMPVKTTTFPIIQNDQKNIL
jgi:hypothetical protein